MDQTAIKDYYHGMIGLLGELAADLDGAPCDLFRGIEQACRLIAGAAAAGKKVMFIGNGGSAAIASHMAIDFWKNGGIKATAFNDPSLLTCLGNDYGYDQVFAKPVEMFGEAGDLLIAISSSGNSANILNGARAAKARGCRVVTLSGFGPDNKLRKEGAVNFYVPSREYGPVEVLHQFLCHYILDILLKERGK